MWRKIFICQNKKNGRTHLEIQKFNGLTYKNVPATATKGRVPLGRILFPIVHDRDKFVIANNLKPIGMIKMQYVTTSLNVYE